jgi:hypothetical protein
VRMNLSSRVDFDGFCAFQILMMLLDVCAL